MKKTGFPFHFTTLVVTALIGGASFSLSGAVVRAADGTPAATPPNFTGADLPYRSYWRLHYGASADFPKTTDVDFSAGRLARICQFLNTRYKPGSALMIDPNTLSLQSDTPEGLVRLKHEMVEWDRTWPQVRLDVYALQLAGNEKVITENRRKVNIAFDKAQQAVGAAMSGLVAIAAHAKSDPKADPHAIGVWNELTKAGFNTNALRQMTLPEVLLFITILPNREIEFQKFQQDFLKRYLEIYPERKKDIENRLENAREVHQDIHSFLSGEKISITTDEAARPYEWRPFSRLSNQFTKGGRDLTLASLEDFLRTWNLYRQDENTVRDARGVGNYGLPQAPDLLRLQAQKGDALFEGAVTALSADLKELIYNPLLDDLKKQSSGGINLVAQNSLVITSSLDGGLGSNGDANFRVDLPQKLTPEEFTKILGDLPTVAAALGAGAASPPITAGATIKALQTSQDFTTALLYESDPAYANLKPTVRVDARPTVQNDGSRARLQLKVTASVGVQPRNADGKVQMGPVDHVESQEGNLDSTISGLDLLQVTATSLSVSHPRPKTGIPILSRIPLLGDAFSWNRGVVTKGFETRVIANAIIIPRSLDMVEFYTSSNSNTVSPDYFTQTPEQKRQDSISQMMQKP